ncbi:MAG TPA: hypothetical protein VF715_07405 [Thermoleophilaceae bacterium]
MTTVDPALPGAEIVSKGMADLAQGRSSEEALLVTAAAPRLRALGLDVVPSGVDAPLHRLYELLATADRAGAHSRYNALIGRITSFARAAEHASTGR